MLHEIALRTTGFDRQLPKYRAYRPVGSVVSVWSEERKWANWLEILRDLAAPYKRESMGRLFRKNLGWTPQMWNAVVEMWSPVLYEEWLEASRLWPEASVLSAVLGKKALANTFDPQQRRLALRSVATEVDAIYGTYASLRSTFLRNAWQDTVATPDLLDALGKDPHGDVPLYETRLWSRLDRRNNFVVAVNTMTSDEVTRLQGFTGDDGGDDATDEQGNVVVMPLHKIDWETRLNLSSATLAEIHDPDKIVDPRFNYPITDSLVEMVSP